MGGDEKGCVKGMGTGLWERGRRVGGEEKECEEGMARGLWEGGKGLFQGMLKSCVGGDGKGFLFSDGKGCVGARRDA